MAQATKTRAKKISATNMVERVPFKKKGAAGGSGHNGAALATVLIQQAEAKAKAVSAEYKSLKERLAEVVLLSHEDHLEFRKLMVERQAQISNAAKLTNTPIMSYRSQNPEANTVYNACSEWVRLSEACDAGWTPKMELGWNELKGLATQHLDRVAREKAIAEKAPTLQAARETLLKANLPEQEKAVKLADVDAKINEAIKDVYKPRGRTTAGNALTPTAPTAPTSAPITEGSGTADVKVQQITKMLQEQSVPVMLQIAKFVEGYMKSKLWEHRLEQFQKLEADRKTTAKKTEGVIGDAKPTTAKEEKATASTGAKRGRKPVRKTSK